MNKRVRHGARSLGAVLSNQGLTVIDTIDVDRQTPYPFVRIAYDKFNNEDCKNKLVLIEYMQDFNRHMPHLPFATLCVYEYAASYEIATIYAEDIIRKFLIKKSRRQHTLLLAQCRENCTQEMKAFALFLQKVYALQKEEPPDI